MGWTLFSLYFLDWEWKCSFGRECFCSSVSLSVFFLGFCSSVLEDGMRWVCIYDRLLPPHNPLLELQHTMHARMELVEWHMHFRWRCIRLHSILQLQGKEFSMAPNFPQRVDMGRNLCGGPVTLVCLKGPRHGSSISTRSSSSPPSYHRWARWAELRHHGLHLPLPLLARLLALVLVLVSRTPPILPRLLLVLQVQENAQGQGQGAQGGLEAEIQAHPSRRRLPCQGLLQVCAVLCCAFLCLLVWLCDAMLIFVPISALIWRPKPLWALRHILRCACQDCLRLPGRRHVPCRGHLLHLHITYLEQLKQFAKWK